MSTSRRVLLFTVGALAAGCAEKRMVLIETEPTGAKLTVNGRFVGSSPQQVELVKNVEPKKRHSIEAVKAGYRRKMDVYWEDAMSDRILIVLEPAEAASDCATPITVRVHSQVPPGQRAYVAVVPFTGDTTAKQQGLDNNVAEWVSTALVKCQRYRVMERSQVRRLVDERQWATTDFGDPAALKKFGKLLGVDYMVLGTVSTFGRLLRVDARLVSTRDGQVFRADQAQCDEPRYYDNLINRIVNNLAAEATPER